MQQETSQESWTVFKRLLGYVRDRKLGLVGGIIGMLGYAAVDTTFVYSIKPLIDQGLNGNDSSVLKWMPFFVLGIVALRGCAAFLSNYCMAWVGNHVVMRLQQQVFSHLMAMPMSFFDRQNTGNLLSKVTYDAGQVSSAASSTLVSLVREGATVIGLLGLMFWHSWQLSVIFLVVGPLVGILISIISRRFRKISRHIQQAVGDITTSTEQMLKGHKEVLMFGGQEVEDKRFYQVSNRMRQQTMKMVAADAIGSPIVQMVASVALAVFLYVATIDSVKATLTAGTFTVMVTSMMMLLKPLKSLTDVNNQFQRGITACQSLFGLLDSTPEQDTGTRTLERARGEIEFRNVTFTYPTKETPALRNISFKVEAGKSVALVGRSGSGKSTIASLLTRFYDIEEGEILLDGVNIREYRLSELRKQYALVSQHVHLFNDSVANNIAYAAEEKYSRDEIKQAARIAHADDFVSKMPEGYDTVIGENGASLSGGQRQRIAIARALLRDSPVLLLDEATSALDTESERHIQAAIDELCKARTSLVIAHRLSTIEKADEILVIDEGHIVERGNHQTLMDMHGTYAQLRAIQFGNTATGNKG
ncbi:lipid A ABC transporter ATP-binding protein/permease MsbA [Aeromonas caviae]|jgi:subfamily B ATP-binding cassette protein MsbA|uniref:Lipid A ABC transporter ATP-binding protein/permease MsbA n=1 Tax=Aeromonas caviae TaxID=648 RepID=A0A3S5WWQ8_AERCA|nr:MULTISPECIES: lipid A ABC transporter ATP-binding protein/permease MsbA [Aeromonas]PZQ94244.1 MAG: lipid A ABC transporter ATP-binding protein/permease MsbA [Aeromonas media]AUT40298.1 lipid A ABC transporter ATP-binding protein/permease MsbA [Aeromonas sp. ASNIH5]AUV15436.1 lipid A ABC transporter ATP-binding protein/permease MsbA [Aeromonas sp. ASNIH7]AXB06319.1 lipid A ABC transporter ATP-binding protein/permease MsbA [Aeromonas caviae]AXB08953.1 lipid A ABC transporter ATP-binding prote